MKRFNVLSLMGLLIALLLVVGSTVTLAQTATPEPPTATPLPATNTPAPPTATPAPPTATPGGGATCNGLAATIVETVGADHEGIVQGTHSDDVILVTITDVNADLTVVGLKGNDQICVVGNSRKVVVNGNQGVDSCRYTGTSQQESYLHCEITFP